MTKSKLSDLNLHLFEQLERLNDDDLEGEMLEKELQRSKAMTDVAQTIINNASIALKAVEVANDCGIVQKTLPTMLLGDSSSEK